MPFKTIAEVRAANRAIDNHWFDRSTMRFFNCVIESKLYGGRFFVTSERMNLSDPKKYTIREALPSGDVRTVSGFRKFSFLEDARYMARHLADGSLSISA
jgi:hypothetical protein